MNKRWSISKTILLSLLVVIAAGLVYLAVIWRKPLGPPLSLSTETSTLQPSETSEPLPSTETLEPTATDIPTNTPTPEPICGGPPTMLILAVGIDYRNANYLYGLSDVIRIVRVDFVNAEISALDIPRAIQVDIPDLMPYKWGCSDRTPGVLNQAYFLGTEGMGCSDAPGFGAGLLARTLEHNFGVRVENYVTVNMYTFALAIDELGGVPIYVFDTIDDRQAAYLAPLPVNGYFEAGNHWLSGIEAVRYARIRSIGGIFGRHDRQNELLVQLREQILKPSIVTKIPGLINAFYGRVLTDLSLEQVTQLACLGLELTMDDIHFLGLPSELFVEGYNQRGDSALFADTDVVSDMIADFVAGRPLEAP